MLRLVYILTLALACSTPSRAEQPQTTVHVVRTGDTLSQIAQRYGVSLQQILRWNDAQPNHIYVGQRLKLWTDGDWYLVRRADNLSRIAQAHRVRLGDLKKWNSLENETIHPGQKLRVAAPPKHIKNEEDEPQQYSVKRGDTLSRIAQRFDIALNLLRRINKLKSDAIHPGQKLRLRPSQLDEAVHMVQSGETLSEIAQRYRIKLSILRRLNDIRSDRILVGQKLRLREASSAVHIVERGDALWEIARAYSMSVSQLKELNDLYGNRIYPGQELKLGNTTAPRYAIYTVRSGDYLGEIARLHQMSIAELKELNHIKGNVIHPRDKLKVRPLRWLENSEIDWQSLQLVHGRKYDLDNGPYYGSRPKAKRQQSTTYYENHPHSPLKIYRRAVKIWQQFEHKVDALGRLSNTLDGWHIVLDPGHGGLDPGAVVQTVGGDGGKLYVTEDEYVYDIALRVYVLLRLHGAQATITLLSPNHLIRHNNPPAATFVNEKNEVYNSLAHNRSNQRSDWPSGGNLKTRVTIAQKAFVGVPKGKRVFLSFHADITPGVPEAHQVLYYADRRGRKDDASRNFARALLPSLGAGARIRGQSLGVLRNNPADVKVLVEMRNMAYRDHVWALRFEQLRHRDAEKVVRGLLDYAGRRSLSARR
jgi:LysM repeat protein